MGRLHTARQQGAGADALRGSSAQEGDEQLGSDSRHEQTCLLLARVGMWQMSGTGGKIRVVLCHDAHRMCIAQGGGARRVVVASVRRGGLADKASGRRTAEFRAVLAGLAGRPAEHGRAVQAGIKSGDLLVSINGKKAWGLKGRAQQRGGFSQ